MSETVAIQAVNIHKAYGNLPVLKGVDLRVDRGEVVAIVGASGAGKSTLLHIIGTLDQPDAGEITVNGHRTDVLSNKQLATFRNTEIGFVFQFHHLLPEFSALENTYMPALIGGTDEKEAALRAEELLSDLGLADRLTHKPAALSGGEQQRVAVARAFVNNPAVILADEPSGNLDSDNSRELHELFFKLRDKYGQTFVIVTHNMDLAAMSDRMFHMKDGLIVQ